MRVGGKPPSVLGAVGALALAVALMATATLLPRSLTPTVVPLGAPQDGTIPQLALSIGTREMMQLSTLRDEALKRGLLFRTENDLVKALIYDGNQHQKAMVRLKGDFIDHLQGDKWSWRVQMKNGGQVLGLRRFSLQAPDTRGYHWEALFLQNLRDEGVLAPRYEFVDLTVNGRDVGVMALEEHFSKELLEAQAHKEGVLLRFDEDEFWRDRSRNDAILGLGKVGSAHDFSWRDARARPFRASKLRKSPLLSRQAALAVGLLRALQTGQAEPSQVLDIEAWGKLFAVAELWGYWHGLRWHNLRFYLNPYTLKLDPVAFDATSKRPAKGSLTVDKHLIFLRYLMSDDAIYDSYRRHLARISEPAALEDRIGDLERRGKVMEEVVRAEYPKARSGIGRHLRRRVKTVSGPDAKLPSRGKIARARTGREVGVVHGKLPHTAAAYMQVTRQGGQAQLELYTGLKEDVVVTELTAQTLTGARPLAELAAVSLPLTLPASLFDEPRRLVTIPLPDEVAANPEGIAGVARVPSDGRRTYPFSAVEYDPVADAPLLPEAGPLEDLLARHPYLAWVDGGLVIEAGEQQITEPLIVPRLLAVDGGVVDRPTLRIRAGADLRFAPEALLLTWGPLRIEGSAEQPVVLGPSGEDWRGLAVLGEATPVVLRHARIARTTFNRWGPWELTGAVTLHQVAATLEHVVFAGTVAEDALNLVRSSFVLRDVEIRNTRSDALDSDFSVGSLEDCAFVDIGGDGIDLSGSTVTATRIRATDVHDKALSIGEASTMTARQLVAERVGVAVVSKDASRTTVTDVEVLSTTVGAFMAYSKKPEYGPGTLTVDGAKLGEGVPVGVVQRGSAVTVDGGALTEVDLDVDALYSSGVMRK